MTMISGTSLLELMFNAPLVVVSKRWPDTLHAADMEAICKAWPDHTAVAACGVPHVRLLVSDIGAVPWPPRVRSLPPGVERCRDCWVATGRMRPRSARS